MASASRRKGKVFYTVATHLNRIVSSFARHKSLIARTTRAVEISTVVTPPTSVEQQVKFFIAFPAGRLLSAVIWRWSAQKRDASCGIHGRSRQSVLQEMR